MFASCVFRIWQWVIISEPVGAHNSFYFLLILICYILYWQFSEPIWKSFYRFEHQLDHGNINHVLRVQAFCAHSLNSSVDTSLTCSLIDVEYLRLAILSQGTFEFTHTEMIVFRHRKLLGKYKPTNLTHPVRCTKPHFIPMYVRSTHCTCSRLITKPLSNKDKSCV